MVIREKRAALTLIELLVSVAIVGILLSMLVSAVQSARETARRLQCNNNLKQIGLAVQLHTDSQRHFPTGGWGNGWVGDSSYGFGKLQSGGWVFNVLPFLERAELRERTRGDAHAISEMLLEIVPTFNCPSRRGADTYPYQANEMLFNSLRPPLAAKSDYAINGGGQQIDSGRGPDSRSQVDLKAYHWPPLTTYTGISFVRSQLRLAEVTDGTSNTYLVGEKYVSVSDETGFGGDDQTMFIGDDADIRRWGSLPPMKDGDAVRNRWSFGSRHPNTCGFAFVDGSVHNVSFSIDPYTHKSISDRKDGRTVAIPQ